MWETINGYINYIKAGLAVGVCALVFFGGYHIGNNRYLEYKAHVELEAKAQEVHNAEVKKQQDLVNKGIKDEYEAKIAAVRNYYAISVRKPSGRSVPGISPTPKGTDAEAAYTILAGQCAETSAQLTSLQDWINQQVGIK